VGGIRSEWWAASNRNGGRDHVGIRSRRAGLVKIAEADGFRPSLGLARREALWAIKALRDEPMPLFAAATAREQQIVPEVDEPLVTLKPMTAGREVVEDYGHIGLSLRQHPVTFLRADLLADRYQTCAAVNAMQDGKSCKLAGLVLVRQRPGSAKNVTFITLEDESGVANLVVWSTLYEKQRRLILTGSMFGVSGRVQREGRRRGPCHRLQAVRPVRGLGQHRWTRRLPAPARSGR
jgi:error-prone DNA polymerase